MAFYCLKSCLSYHILIKNMVMDIGHSANFYINEILLSMISVNVCYFKVKKLFSP